MPDVASTAYVHSAAVLGQGVVVMANAWIGANVFIDAGTVIGPNAVVGHGDGDRLSVGRNCQIANGATIYHSVTLGDRVRIRHHAVVREKVQIGEGTSLGTGSSVEPATSIGRFCSFHCRVHITDYSAVGDYVFVGPGFISLSDLALDYRRPQIHKGYKGVILANRVRIGGGVLALPGCEVGEAAIVGAGSQISGLLKPRCLYLGNPARAVRRISEAEEITVLS